MNNKHYRLSSMLYRGLLLLCLFSTVLCFAANPTKPTTSGSRHAAPTITCPSDVDVYVECTLDCSKLIRSIYPVVKDDTDPNPKVWCEVNGKGIDSYYCFSIGKTTVNCYAQNKSGEKSSCSYIVNVKFKEDYIAPKITCPQDIMASLTLADTKLNKMCRTINLPSPTATDNCDPAPSLSCTYYDNTKEAPVDKNYCYPMGKTRILCIAKDKAGNSSSCIFWVAVMRQGDLIKAVDDNTLVIGTKNKVKQEDKETDLRGGDLNTMAFNPTINRKMSRNEMSVIYPNPTSDFINLALQQYEGKNARVQVLNAMGQEIYCATLNEVTDQAYRIDMQAYPKGMYFIKLTADGIESVVKKVMKQ